MSEIASREGEQQYGELVASVRDQGGERLGFMTSWAWSDDPKRLAFTLSRYKFVAKMLAGMDIVAEIGCGDGFGARVVRQSVSTLIAVDFDPEFLESARSAASDKYPIVFLQHDMLSGPLSSLVSACYSLDVLEHILPENEDSFLVNIVRSLTESGVCIVGTPSLESQLYASKYSRLGHVNCKSQEDLCKLMSRFFENVFMFSMNDEVVHTGFARMSQYNLALCCGPKAQTCIERS